MNTNRQTTRHIIIKNDKFTENFKGSKRKIVIYKEIHKRLSADFTAETYRPERIMI